MNKSAKHELMFLTALGALTALTFRHKKLGLALAAGTAALAFSKNKTITSFAGKTVIITGGSRGLGLALAKKLVVAEANVCLIARTEKDLDLAEQILANEHPLASVLTCICDITDPSQFRDAVQKTIERWGTVDILINNAGAILVGPFDSMTPDDFLAQMKVHLFANINATKEILKQFRKTGEGHIINICSMGGKVAAPHMLPYDTSKFALAGFSQGLTAELAAENISVLTVYPALMRTGSPIQAVFKGDSKKEFSWFASADVFPGLSSNANDIADQILEAAKQRRSELIPSLIGKSRMAASVLFPELMLWGMGLLNKILPKNSRNHYATGAQSRNENSYLIPGLKSRSEKAEADLNQVEKTDPEYNIGLTLH